VVATLLPRAEVTVVIVPLIALRQDLLRRCEQWGISFRRWPDGGSTPITYPKKAISFLSNSHLESLKKLTVSHLGGKSLLVQLDITGLRDCSEWFSSLVKNQLAGGTDMTLSSPLI
jgi:hypothetical protein